MFQPQSQRKLYKFGLVFFYTTLCGVKGKHDWCNEKKINYGLDLKEICAYSHFPTLYMCGPVSETNRTHLLQYPSHWVTWELRPLWSHELVMQYPKLYPSDWSVFWNLRDHQQGLIILHMWDRQFWELCNCMCLYLWALAGW